MADRLSPASSRIAGIVLVGGIGAFLAAAILGFFAYAATIEDVPDYGGTYIEGTLGPPHTLVPMLASDDTARTISTLVFNGLTRFAENGEVVPDLATGWEIDPQDRSFVFHLRDDVTWHDGAQFSVDDVLFTYALMSSPRRNDPVWSNVRVEREGDRSVRFFLLNDVYIPLLEYVTIGILPQHILDGVSSDQILFTPFNLQPIGTGPYRVEEFTEEYVLLSANADYFDGRPRIRFLKFKFYPNAKATITALERGEVEGVGYLPSTEIGRVAEITDVQAYSAPLAGYTVLYFNLRRSPMFDPLVRQAMAHAVDREYLASVVQGGMADPLEGPILPVSWAHSDDVPRYVHDPARSRALLEEAGWSIGPDGIRVKGDARLSLTLLVPDLPGQLEIAEAIKGQLEVVSFEIAVKVAGPSTLLNDFLLTHEFDIALYTWVLKGLDPDPYVTWHSSQIESGWNFSGFIDPRVDESLQNARNTLDQNERKRMYADFQQTFAEEIPSLMLLSPRYSFAVRNTVRGVSVPAVLPRVESRLSQVSSWYIKTKKNVLNVRSPFQGWRIPFLS
jgi:peptide/nickel transport system substrate-binding protein